MVVSQVFSLSDNSLSNLISLMLIFLLGIPHGAIDNHLFLQRSDTAPIKFYSVYLLAIAVNALFWFLLPIVALLFFILLSAYHFGQAQFANYRHLPRLGTLFTQFFWGLLIILMFIYFNRPELLAWTETYADLQPFRRLLATGWLSGMFIFSATMTGLLFVMALFRKWIPPRDLIVEVLLIAAVLLSSIFLPFLAGFALFFVIMHSFRVMGAEFWHFYDRLSRQNLSDFIRLLAPLSLLSFIGLGVLAAAIYSQFLPLSLPFLLLISISSITLPHAFVMERFYRIKKSH
jgi:Brp/Blh family beta-carotene 15,15'-monooxygenase